MRIAWFDKKESSDGKTPDPSDSRFYQAIGLIAIAIFLTGAIVWFLSNNAGPNPPVELKALTFIVIAVLGMTVALTVLAVTLHLFGLSDPKQALALPEGSVRSVIALSILMIFSIIFVVVFSAFSNGSIQSVSNLTRLQMEALTKNLGEAVVTVVPPPDAPATGAATGNAPGGTGAGTTAGGTAGGTTAGGTTAGGTAGGSTAGTGAGAGAGAGAAGVPPATFTVYYRATPSRDAVDFGKQGLAALLTLLTSVVSFYFGARTAIAGSVEGANAALDALKTGSVTTAVTPTITAVDPPSAAPGEQGVYLTITGTGLDRVNQVSLISATGAQLPTGAVTVVSATEVKVAVVVLAGTAPGTYRVEVKTSDGKTAAKDPGFEVTAQGG